MNNTKTDAELEREAIILADQADRFVKQFGVDLSGAEQFINGSRAFCQAGNAYERIALAEKSVDLAE